MMTRQAGLVSRLRTTQTTLDKWAVANPHLQQAPTHLTPTTRTGWLVSHRELSEPEADHRQDESEDHSFQFEEWHSQSTQAASSRGEGKAQQEGLHVGLLRGAEEGGHEDPAGPTEDQAGQAAV